MRHGKGHDGHVVLRRDFDRFVGSVLSFKSPCCRWLRWPDGSNVSGYSNYRKSVQLSARRFLKTLPYTQWGPKILQRYFHRFMEKDLGEGVHKGNPSFRFLHFNRLV